MPDTPLTGTPPLDLALLAEVHAGLTATQKRLPSKFLYDRRGSALFEQITALPEYYLARAEREILGRMLPGFLETLAPRTVAELGAGSGAKTRAVLEGARACGSLARYVPIDLSRVFLEESAAALAGAFPGLDVTPVVGDLEREVPIPADVARPLLVLFLGSTIGNFAAPAAVRLLRRTHAALRPGDRLLLGADLVKSGRTLEAAYNDAAGVTAAFNRNILRVINRRFGSDFDIEAYTHRACWRPSLGRMEMHLVAEREQLVTLPGAGAIPIEAGETIRTEISCKYDREQLAGLLWEAGFRLERWETDAGRRFAVLTAEPL